MSLASPAPAVARTPRAAARVALLALARELTPPASPPVAVTRFRGEAARALRDLYETLRDGSPDVARALSQIRALEGAGAIAWQDARAWASGWEAAS